MAGIGESLTDELYLKLAEHTAEKRRKKDSSQTEFAASSSSVLSDTNIPRQYSGRERGRGRVRCRGTGIQRGRGFSRDHSLDQGREAAHRLPTENVATYQRRSHSVQGHNGTRNVYPEHQQNFKNFSHSHRPVHRDTKQIGFKGLLNLTNKTSSDVVATLANSQYGFEDLLKSSIKPDLMIIIMQVLVKVCDHGFSQLKTSILSHACDSNFLEQIELHLAKMPAEDSAERKSSMKSFILNLLHFFEAVINIFPNTASERFKKLFIHTDVMMRGVEEYQSMDLKDQKEKFCILKRQLDIIIEERTRKGIKENSISELQKHQLPPDDFRGKDIFPTQEDLFGKAAFIRPNIKEGAYVSVDHYLDIQFRLLREDFVRPLREGVSNFVEVFVQNKGKKRIENVRMYRNVSFGNPKLVNDQLGITVIFDPERKLRVNWEFSKRFMYGALVCFTNDNFKSVVFGTVAEREIKDLTTGVVTVVLNQSVEKSKDILSSQCVMLESQVYFEPYKLVLKALQDMDENSFPMKKYIISVDKEVCHPKYLKADTCVYDISSHKVSVLNEASWPDATNLGLDPSQHDAFKAALTQEFVVIQGPPGTGKTFLGLKIASVLLNNPNPWNQGKTPILVVCFTNHALDQFLEGLLPVTRNIVRVGGQSKSKELAQYNLKQRRKNFSNTFTNRRLEDDIHGRMSRSFANMKQIQVNIEEIEMNRGVISLETLCKTGIIQPHHLTGFGKKDQRLCDWLLDGLDNFVTAGLQMEGVAYVDNEDRTDEDTIQVDEEYEEHWHKIEFDHLFFDTSKITSSVSYALDVLCLEKEKNHLENALRESELDVLQNPNNLHRLNLLNYQYHKVQEEFLYWKALLDQKHNADPGYIAQLNARRNLWQLPVNDRWILYKSWVSAFKKLLLEDIRLHEDVYRELARQFEEVKQLENLEVMKSSLVVGMTTTSAARLQTMLQALKSKIVIVEEAAEVMESHIVVSLTDKCEHLILIGDHKQLRPNTSVYELARHYFFDISLFERMVNNGMHCYCLNVQHRMRPEVAKLIVPSIYPILKNHDSVMKYPEVLGIKKSLFFITHSYPEEEVDDILSHKNTHEAKFILELCRYLILQGYAPNEITVLSTYKGQMFCMKKMQRNMDILADVKVTVVDNFQGEENKIILLSLVRSNSNSKIGFLSIENRVCVALSRAREGLYVIGNMNNLEESSKIWPKVKEVLLEQEAFGSYLSLKCQIHSDQETAVSTGDDFKKVPEGGCSLPCKATLLCGHECKSVCHVNNRDHKKYKCQQDCQRIPPECPLAHPCPKRCYQDCGKCETVVERLLPCKHVKRLACHVDCKTYKCMEMVKVTLEKCGHEVNKPCHVDASTFTCPFPCEDRLQCGHSCTLLCHPLKDPDHSEYKCRKPCARKNAGCSMDHLCIKRCYEECGDCDYEVDKKLPSCGHKCRVKCSADLALIQCKLKCKRMLSCGHHCKRICYQPCGGCEVKVLKIIPDCGHEIKTKCSSTPAQSDCRKPCNKTLSCGHACTRTCGDPCTASECEEIVFSPVRPICGHEIKIPCCLKTKVQPSSRILLDYCRAPCAKVLACGHLCKGSCGECAQGRIHAQCGEKCDRNLICGHRCRFPCSATCPPCRSKCEYKCQHSRCGKNCGVPCVPCKEMCDWKCEHKKCSKFCSEICDRDPCYEPCKNKLKKCGHPCIGFCGDPCPPLCRICDEEEVKNIFFGYEDEDDARFVFLVDCKHTLESKGLEEWFRGSDAEISMKTCPRCKSYIRHTPRFMKIVKLSLENVQEVKNKVFGSLKTLQDQQQALKVKLGILTLPPYVAHCSKISSSYFKMLNMMKQELISSNDDRGRPYFSKGKQKFPSRTHIECIAKQIEIFEDILATLKTNVVSILKPDFEKRLYEDFEFLVKRLMERSGKITPQETSDFNQECKRFQRITQLVMLENSVVDRSVLEKQEAKVLLKEAHDLANSINVYTDETDRSLKKVLDQLKTELRVTLALTERERREIVQAMGLKQGHWYKCPNGHIYCITECGGAMMESNCPDCKERIGGSSHRLLPSNRLASEMDGATRSAWPGTLH